MSDATLVEDDRPRPGSAVIDAVLGFLKRNERPVLIAAVAAQLLLLAGMVAVHATPLLVGKTVLLRVEPVDPRDFFRGDYVILGYDFSRVPADGTGPLAHLDYQGWSELRDRTVYVSLVPESDGEHWRADGIGFERPADGTYLCGRVAGYGQLAFGIEAFYLQEGEGPRYEQAAQNGTLSAEVAVAPNGQATLRGLKIEAEPRPSAVGAASGTPLGTPR